MLRVLRIGSTPSSISPGAGQAVWNLSDSDYFETDLITYKPALNPKKASSLNIHVVPFDNPTRPKTGGRLLLYRRMVKRVLRLFQFSYAVMPIARSKKFDIVHLHTPMHFLVGLYFKLFTKSKIMLTLHGSEIKLFEKYNFLKYLLFIYDTILVVSNEQLDVLAGLFGGKVVFIANAVDSVYFEPSDELSETRSTLRAANGFSIVSVGSLRWQKNYQMLLEAIAISKHKNMIKLTLVGVGSEMIGLGKLAKALNVETKFTGTLSKEHIIKILDQSDLFILTSVVEGAPKALIEAMARGLYCITTPVGECEAILDMTGHCLNSFSVANLAQKLDDYIDDSAESDSERIKAVAKSYTWENYLNLHCKIYGDL